MTTSEIVSQGNQASWASSLGVLVDSWTTFKRWMIKTVRNPFILGFGLIQPVVWLLLFTQVFQAATEIPGFSSGSYLAFFAPAVLIQSALFSGMGAGMGLIEDIRIGVFNKVLASPMKRPAIFIGLVLSGLTVVSLQVLVLLAVALAMGAQLAAGPLGVLGILLVSAVFFLGFAGLSTIIALGTKSSQATIIIGNFLALPLLFISSAFVPVRLLPGWLQGATALNPVRYAIDATREIMLSGWSLEPIGLPVAALLGFGLITMTVASIMLRRATDSRPRA